ncbi:SpoIVB peptidase S55 domain-containing protein [Rummeliibacillus stabekisii]|uniref:SpoIVB peptidase S55 domain-containing protein n=1 Tax=Rummeliibacillus stabekisii TaxID=241244 RepID=UPI0011BD69B7|nr:SpoIVB peptidase S55 domain-containing protein [Rummeliibacillus stabekisii]MBB5169472.1 stage IV sporulation protein B [Rummeliibacillus stabekisii]
MRNAKRSFLSLIILLGILLSMSTMASAAKKVIPMGDSIGVELQLANVTVSNDVLLQEGSWLKRGDIVKKVNKTKIKKLENIHQILKSSSKDAIKMTVGRDGEDQTVKVRKEEMASVMNFLRDETDGIGTLTFLDPETKQYGALGHQIIDQILQEPPNFNDGSIFYARIEHIKKSIPGEPGYKISSVENGNGEIGDIELNSSYGIFGKWQNTLQPSLPKAIEIMQPSQIKKGPAKILTTIQGKKVETFDITITKVNNKSFQIEVTDPVLKEKTGGILQGMSGSPIIQNGHFAGAVTHMYIESPEKGAALPITEMLKNQPA